MPISLAGAARLFLDHRRRKRRSPATLELYDRQLADWRAWRDLHGHGAGLADVGLAELRAFFGELDDGGCSPATIRGYYRTLRALWRFLEFEENAQGRPLLAPQQLRFFRNDRIPLPELDRRERPALCRSCYEQLLAAAAWAEEPEQQARDELILRLLWETGLRVHEVAGLRDEDLDRRARTARLIGKGRKQAVVFWGPLTAAALTRYLRLRRGRPGGPLLRGVSSRNNGEPVTPNLVRLLVKRLAARAEVELPPGSPCHSFRRAFARRARNGGATEEEVGILLRDQTPAVVRDYIGLDAGPRRSIYDRVFDLADSVGAGQAMYP